MRSTYLRQYALILGYGVATVLLLGTIYSHVVRQKAQHEYAVLLDERAYPRLIAGLDLSHLDDHTAVLRQNAAHERPSQRLLLYVNDSCPYCKREMPQWRELFRAVKWRASQEIIVVSANGQQLASTLADAAKRAGAHYRVWIVEERLVFGPVTGLVATPMTILLDSDYRVREVFGSTLDRARQARLLTTLNEPESNVE